MDGYVEFTNNLRDFVKPINEKFSKLADLSGTPPVVFRIDYDVKHIVDRMHQRNVNRGIFGSAITKVLERHYCEILYTGINRKEKFKNGDVMSSTFFISSCYKDIKVILRCNYSESRNVFFISPKTVLTKNMKSETQLEFDITEV